MILNIILFKLKYIIIQLNTTLFVYLLSEKTYCYFTPELSEFLLIRSIHLKTRGKAFIKLFFQGLEGLFFRKLLFSRMEIKKYCSYEKLFVQLSRNLF